MLRIDVAIVGGGLQGLLLLDECVARGRSCALVTDSDLGAGQTLHSHGVLNTGFGFSGPGLRETRDQLVVPFLRARGVSLYGDWFLITPDDVQVGESATAEDLPAGFDVGRAQVRRLREFNFPKRQLVERLGRNHLNRIVRGRIVDVRGAGTIETVSVELVVSGAKLVLAPAVVIAATGTGTKRFVSSVVGASTQLSKIRHRRVHIVCVRGPASVLPATSLLSLTHGLNLVAHSHGETVTWYSTPFQDADPNFDVAPDDAEADVDPVVVAGGFQRLEKLFPPIAMRRELRFTAYAGYRQDIGETVGTPMCERVDGVSNLLMALPSLVVNAWSNAKVAADIVDALAPARVHQSNIPGSGVGVQIGRPREDRPEVVWKTWRTLSKTRKVAEPTRRISAYQIALAPRSPSTRRVGPFHARFDPGNPNPFGNHAIPEPGATPSPANVAELVRAYRTQQRTPCLEYIAASAGRGPAFAPAQGIASSSSSPRS